MTPDWTPLREELAIWLRNGLELPFWWRDDDAIDPTGALSRLADLSQDTGVPVHLAIIPKHASLALATEVASTDMLIPVVHGWAHENYAPATEKKSEFGVTRALDDCVSDLQRATERFRDLFGARAGRMFVPPWNRGSPEVTAALAECGFNAVSTFLPRKAPEAAPGLAQINTHIDPIFWRGTRGLVDPDELIAKTVRQLSARRNGAIDNGEPFGYLTHHLVHDADIWEFSRQFLCEMCGGPIRLYRHDRGVTA